MISNVFETLFDYNEGVMTSKQAADLLTAVRGLIALALAGVGLVQGVDGLYLAAWLLLLAWITDALDGPLARNSRRSYRSWLGEHDLQIDMAVSAGLFVYLIAAGWITPLIAGFYVVIWAVVFAHWGLERSLGMLVQAPVYGRFLWAILQTAPEVGFYLVAFLVVLIIATWPRFPQQVIPGFLGGLQSLRPAHPDNDTDPKRQNGTSNKLNL